MRRYFVDDEDGGCVQAESEELTQTLTAASEWRETDVAEYEEFRRAIWAVNLNPLPASPVRLKREQGRRGRTKIELED